MWYFAILYTVFNVPSQSHIANLIIHSVLTKPSFRSQLGTSVLLVKAHFKNLHYLEDIGQTEAETPVVFLVRNPFNAIVAEKTRALRTMVSEYLNDTHTSSDIHERQFGEFLMRTALGDWAPQAGMLNTQFYTLHIAEHQTQLYTLQSAN